MDDFRKLRPRAVPAGWRHGQPWWLDLLQRVSLRTWLTLGAILVACLGFAIWALVALWQSVGERAPGWQQTIGAMAGEVAPAANPEAIVAAGSEVVAGAVTEARTQVNAYAAQIDQVVPGASGRLQAAAEAWLGKDAEAATQAGSTATGEEAGEAP